MRIAFLLSSDELDGATKKVVVTMSNQGHIVEVILPSRSQDDRVYLITKNIRCRRVNIGESVLSERIIDLLRPDVTDIMFDAIINQNVSYSYFIRSAMDSDGLHSVYLPIVNMINTIDGGDIFSVCNCMCDVSVFSTIHDMDVMIENAGKFLNASNVKVFCDRMFTVFSAIDFPRFITRKNDIPTLFCYRADDESKNFNIIVNALEKLYRIGMDFEVKVADKDIERVHDRWGSFPFVSAINSDGINDSDVFVCASSNSSDWPKYLEMLLSGMVGVFLWKDWMKGLVPSWYPFVVYEEKHLISCIKYVLVKVERSRGDIDWTKLREFYEDLFNNKTVSDGIIAAIGKAFKMAPVRKMANWVISAAEESGVKKEEVISLQGAFDMLKRNKKWKSRGGDKLNKFHVRKILLELGFSDIGSAGEVEFRRI
jgi:hypothetical protein